MPGPPSIPRRERARCWRWWVMGRIGTKYTPERRRRIWRAVVHLAGQRSDVATWYRAADVYVISSHNEGLSNSMIEALAFGLPVISTRVSGSSILVESPAAGLVVDVGNVENACRRNGTPSPG